MIRLENIYKTYPTPQGGVVALTDVNLSVARGEIFGVIGKSGAGKSTLIRCVNLLERPDRGEVIVNGRELTKLSSSALRAARHDIGMIFQHFNLLNTRTVYQNVAFPLQLLGENKKAIDQKVMPLLDLTGLTPKKDVYPSQLSGGQKQRVAIARALATNPAVLLCDEMTSALDPETTQSILQLIKNINQQFNLSVLLITHEMTVIKAIADRVAVIDQGKIVEQNDVVSLFKRPQTAIAKRFTRAVIENKIPEKLQAQLKSTPMAEGYVLLRIDFVGQSTAEPVIHDLIKQFDWHISIIEAHVEMLRQEMIGMMLIIVKVTPTAMQQGLAYLTSKDLQTEVLGYVAHHDWFSR